MTTLYIRNMVCPRCIRVVREEFEAIHLVIKNIALGEVTLEKLPSPLQMKKIKVSLGENGFELIEDKNRRTIEQIKHAILKMVRNDYELHPIRVKDSVFIAREVGQEYHTLSTLFSSVENITIEHYLVLQRVERIKELLKYGELSLTEISFKLGFSSVAHLSNQFKKVTGMSPSTFRLVRKNARLPIDLIGKKPL
jgi:AraC family transcriptional regulator